jgi:hypothetical protein
LSTYDPESSLERQFHRYFVQASERMLANVALQPSNPPDAGSSKNAHGPDLDQAQEGTSHSRHQDFKFLLKFSMFQVTRLYRRMEKRAKFGAIAKAVNTAYSAETGVRRRSTDVASSIKMKAFVCPLFSCGQLFKRMEQLRLHLRTHTMEGPFEYAYRQAFCADSTPLQRVHPHPHEMAPSSTSTNQSACVGAVVDAFSDCSSAYSESEREEQSGASEVEASDDEGEGGGKEKHHTPTRGGFVAADELPRDNFGFPFVPNSPGEHRNFQFFTQHEALFGTPSGQAGRAAPPHTNGGEATQLESTSEDVTCQCPAGQSQFAGS